jgi:hypothetical protein
MDHKERKAWIRDRRTGETQIAVLFFVLAGVFESVDASQKKKKHQRRGDGGFPPFPRELPNRAVATAREI